MRRYVAVAVSEITVAVAKKYTEPNLSRFATSAPTKK
jgi:hypothetical protein